MSTIPFDVSSTGGGSRGRSPGRRRAILDAADAVIQRDGPDATMAAIATRAGISKPILYRHFGDKSGLYRALAARHVDPLVERIRHELTSAPDLRHRADATIGVYLGMIRANLNLYRFLMHRATAEDPGTRGDVGMMVRRLGLEVATLFTAEGRIADPARAQTMAHAIIGMVREAGEWWLDHPEVAMDQVVEDLVGAVVGAVEAVSATPDPGSGLTEPGGHHREMDNVDPAPEPTPVPSEVISRVAVAHARVRTLVEDVDESLLRSPSGLANWTRAHVVVHLANNARALERQVRFALRGERVEVYDGGQEGRDRAIEEGVARSRDDLLTALRDAQAELEGAWSTLGPQDWGLGVAYRDGTVLDTAFARWREAEIHAVDLALGYRPRDWSIDFTLHALDFLELRVPQGTRLELHATDTGATQTLGAGRPVQVHGALRDLAAWLAGRDTDGRIDAEGAELPTLGPWPTRSVAR